MKVVVLACGNAVPDSEDFQAHLKQGGMQAQVIAQPCSSKVETYHLLRILASGVDLVWVIGCAENACRLTEGSSRMGKRVQHAQEYLSEIGLENERIGMSRLVPGDAAALSAILADIQTRARALRPSPLAR